MAVLALNAKTLDVVLVAEGYWLVRTLPLTGYPWGALQLVQRYSQRNHNQSRQDQAHTRKRI
jgi:hypothetical protein